ncbi:diguanylate cyclase domain-containing protein [Tepiditoga spiralis]|uniref:diguanylate cyclase domain-containing protein n=1 Tax=Tepiditoga spiralis TaxID=2108365 RepID=UPI0016865C4C|nr:diguanylate cyclase [Tepiditoga spiralis]
MIAINILDRIQKSLNYIEENLYEDIKIDKVAEEAFMSVSLFYKLFSKIIGTTLKDYIRKRRLSLSKKDLIETKQSILEIALKYQYETYESYSRSFKKLFGISPKKYRESTKNVDEYNVFQKINLIYGGVNMNEEKIKEKINLFSNGFIFDFDIDNFSLINKNYGRKMGDIVLIEVPVRINKVLENNNIKEEVIRIDADEFALILKGKDEELIKIISNEIINSMKEPINFEGTTLNVTVSVGITKFSNDTFVIEKVRKAMIEAKNNGRNQFNII